MLIVRSIAAVLAGFVALFLVVLIGAVCATALLHVRPGTPTPPYLVANLAVSLLAGACGGGVCRWLAPVNPSRFVWVLAAVVGGLGLIGTLRPSPGQPHWYGWTVTALGVIGVAAGGRAWKR